MNIVHMISGGDVGGAKTHVLTLLKGLTETQNVKLICFKAGDFSDEAKELGIDTLVIETADVFKAARSVRKIIGEVRVSGGKTDRCPVKTDRPVPTTALATSCTVAASAGSAAGRVRPARRPILS